MPRAERGGGKKTGKKGSEKKKEERRGEAGADTGGKKFERVKMFLAWCIMDALRANIMRFYSAIHIKHRKQQKAGGSGVERDKSACA